MEIKEAHFDNYAESMTPEQMEKALFQMKYSICKIELESNKYGTGFFCQIKIPNSMNYIYVMITNNHVLGENELALYKKISFTMNNGEYSDSIYIDGSRNIYTDIDKDVTIIEIDNKSFIKFLDIDEDIYKENPNKYFKNISVYIIHYEKGKKTKFSNGLIKCIEEDDYTIRHICPTEHGSSGSPILNLNNYKVIGVHKGTKEGKNWNLGTILKSPIDDFIKEISKETEINILLHNKCVSKKTVKVIDSLFSLRNKLRNDIKVDFFFVDYDEVDKNDENNIIIKEILKNNKDIEICYNLVIDKYSNTNPESNHELVYQYYYDKFNTDDYMLFYL